MLPVCLLKKNIKNKDCYRYNYWRYWRIWICL